LNIVLAFWLWPLLALIAFKVLPPHKAVLSTVLGGWILLPVGIYPAGATSSVFPYWLVGSAVPSDMLVTKAWVAPASAMIGMVLTDWRRLSKFKANIFDLPILGWCLWPVIQGYLTQISLPDAVLSSSYLIGTWGFPWLLGRLYFSNFEKQRSLLIGIAWSGLACFPFALWEGMFGPTLYDLFYEPHPFAKDGIERYIGWRPIGFFENGNQYGLWVCLSTLATLWACRSEVTIRIRAAWKWGAILALMIALFSQSIGAIILLAMGYLCIEAVARMRIQSFLIPAFWVILAVGVVYLSGTAPISYWGKETVVGRKIVDGFRATGRGSLPWRISQDQKAIILVKPKILTGHGTWNWWDSLGARPWGLALLIIGQFGLVGLLGAFGALIAPAIKTTINLKIESQWNLHGATTILATIVFLALIDALLNSFFFFPAILTAAALVQPAEY
jgi:hypothetical protein